MNKIKHISIKVFSFLALLILFSAGNKIDMQSIISQEIGTNHVSDQLPSTENKAFKAGEVLTYRMHYGLINAGVAILEVKPNLIEVNGRKVYHIVGSGYTIGSTDWFFKVRDRYETYLDKDALLPWMFVRRVDEGGYKFSQDYAFNHYTKKVDIGNNEKFDVPVGIQDMVSAFYSARNMDLSNAKAGDLFSITCFVDKEIWPLKIKFIGKETIETDLGKYRCLKFRPIVQKGRVFKKEEDLNVWISDDDNHLPMRVKADVLIGSIKMDITGAKNLANISSKVD
ncbi:MAG: DUF3108 domain-containing protein [Bacteroidota bacterium]|nr:DUF3108 domain-containing protein [Bacteroidota bacterium]MDP3144370.1 DUF3108 domain-containing protein [Bacteroidota bacterium]MDP3555952.1 DUF3108 domain-containing protein [Bacteroidota bacterium]